MTFPRSRIPERMDDPSLPEADHRRALVGLARLNRVSGVSRAIYRRLKKYAKRSTTRPLRVLDVACGSGDLPIDWAMRAARDGWPLQVTGVDVSEVAIEAMCRQACRLGVDVGAMRRDCLTAPLPPGFDIVTCSLFMHHLDDAAAVRLLQSMRAAAGQAVLVCDLERSRVNLALVSITARLLTRSDVVRHDAAASVRAAYTRDEFRELLQRATVEQARIESLFPCRFLVSIDELGIPVVAPAFA